MMHVVELKNVTKTFTDPAGRAITAARDVSFEANQGELVTLLGPSGCGKTTLLRIIGGFEVPTAGEVRIEGRAVTFQPPNQRNTSMVFQSYALFPHMSVFENVAYGLRVKRLPREKTVETVHAMLDIVGLQGLEGRAPGQLSGGQQQRVALARALVNEPAVLLFDEPLSNLDAKMRVQMREEIRRLQKRVGITSVYVTHDQEEAMCLSDRIVVMNAGVIEQVGTPEYIYRHPETHFVAAFFGRVNFVPMTVEQVSGDIVPVSFQGHRFSMKQPGAQFRVGDMVDVIVRPESVALAPETPGKLTAKVTKRVYMGNAVDYTLVLGDLPLLAVVPGGTPASNFLEGDTVAVDFLPETLHVLTMEKN